MCSGFVDCLLQILWIRALFFIYDLEIFHLYVQSLRTSFGHPLVWEKLSNIGKASDTDLPCSEIVQQPPQSALLYDLDLFIVALS